MSHLVLEALSLGAVPICSVCDVKMDVRGKSGRYGHQVGEGAFHVCCEIINSDQHSEGCECKEEGEDAE